MQTAIARAHHIVARLILVGFVVQIYLAGLGAFGAASYEMHRVWGYLLSLPILLLVVLALAGRIGRRGIGATVLLFGLYVVQFVLPGLRVGLPYVAALHVLNALALLGAAAAAARASAGFVAARAARTDTPASVAVARGREHGAP